LGCDISNSMLRRSNTKPLGSRDPPAGFTNGLSKPTAFMRDCQNLDACQENNEPSFGSIGVEISTQERSRPSGARRENNQSFVPRKITISSAINDQQQPEQINTPAIDVGDADIQIPPVSQSPANECFVCNEKLQTNQKIARTLHGTTHMDCFRCSKCRMSLELSEFYLAKQDGELYCHLDYHQKFSPLCGLCKTPVESQGIFALGRYWHSDHLFCSQCSNHIGVNDEYFVITDLILCSNCHTSKTAVKCWKCRHPCAGSEEAIEALGRQWCSSCFACEECTAPFKHSEFILREDGDLVCHQCEERRIKQFCWNPVKA
jgi:hypothetical protein